MVSNGKLRMNGPNNAEDSAGGYMKSKKLTILFFSIVMLAASPRVMSYFNNYADVLGQKAEAEWLSFLVGFAAPAEIKDNTASTEDPPHATVCINSTNNQTEPAIVQPSAARKATPHSIISKKRTFEFAMTHAASASNEIGRETLPAGMHIYKNASWRIAPAPLVPGGPVAVNTDIRSKAEYLWTLSQSTRNGDRKAARELVKELSVLFNEKKWSGLSIPAKFEKVIDPPDTTCAKVPEPDTSNRSSATDEAMR